MTARIEKLSRAESKRRSKMLEKWFRPKEVERFDLLDRGAGFVTG